MLITLASLSLPIVAFGLVSARRSAPQSSTPLHRIQSVSGPLVAVGGDAPAITWRDAVTGKEVSLSDFRGKPVLLFHGSYTCPPFRISAGLLEQIAKRYQGRVQSLFVYSREAHKFIGTTPQTKNPVTIEDREKAAHDLVQESGFTMPVLIDTLENKTEKLCDMIPSRVIVIDAHGKIAYLSGIPSSQIAFPVPAVLDRLLAKTSDGTSSKPLPSGRESD
jgi:peroxiredoxin